MIREETLNGGVPAPIVLGIDASRNRSGGPRAHLIGVLTQCDPRRYGIERVHLWSYRSLLEAIPDRPWLYKHNPQALQRSLAAQLLWQKFSFPDELRKAGVTILLNTTATTISRYRPAVTMSRDMLSYEPGQMKKFGLSLARLRLEALLHVQNSALRNADGVIFLTQYAGRIIQQRCGPLTNVAYIPFGIGEHFKQASVKSAWPEHGERPVRCFYVSNTDLYKNQWTVVRAIELLRKKGHDVELTLIGGGSGLAQKRLNDQVQASDPEGRFVRQLGFVSHRSLPTVLSEADLFIFASSCENMPNTLLEAMALGLPIACSDRGPMPEVLEGAGMTFDPEDHQSIAHGVEQIIADRALRAAISERARRISQKYSWARCADETWTFITKTAVGVSGRLGTPEVRS